MELVTMRDPSILLCFDIIVFSSLSEGTALSGLEIYALKYKFRHSGHNILNQLLRNTLKISLGIILA